jgi:hypothetical protein
MTPWARYNFWHAGTPELMPEDAHAARPDSQPNNPWAEYTFLDARPGHASNAAEESADKTASASEIEAKDNAMIEAIRLDAPDRIDDDMRSVLAGPDTFSPTLERIMARRQEIAGPLYEVAHATSLPDLPIIREIIATPAGRQAVTYAKRLTETTTLPSMPIVFAASI